MWNQKSALNWIICLHFRNICYKRLKRSCRSISHDCSCLNTKCRFMKIVIVLVKTNMYAFYSIVSDFQVLDMSPERQSCLFYHLPQVPPNIARLRHLRVLMLDTNDLPVLPPEICALAGLERLSISNNCLTGLPEGFSRLQNLSSLHAANNLFEHFPGVICGLKALTFLDMSDNRLETLPEAIGQIITLESLLLYANRLEIIPDSISQLTELRCLWIGQNRLRRLPRSMERLRQLDWGRMHTWSTSLDGNPLEEPPVDVCKRGVRAIGEYFEARERAVTPKTEEDGRERRADEHDG